MSSFRGLCLWRSYADLTEGGCPQSPFSFAPAGLPRIILGRWQVFTLILVLGIWDLFKVRQVQIPNATVVQASGFKFAVDALDPPRAQTKTVTLLSPCQLPVLVGTSLPGSSLLIMQGSLSGTSLLTWAQGFFFWSLFGGKHPGPWITETKDSSQGN